MCVSWYVSEYGSGFSKEKSGILNEKRCSIRGKDTCSLIKKLQNCILGHIRVTSCLGVQNKVTKMSRHCNTLQHTATHCNTLQRTATHYNTPTRRSGSQSPIACFMTMYLVVYPFGYVFFRPLSIRTPQHTLEHITTHCNIMSYIHFDTLLSLQSTHISLQQLQLLVVCQFWYIFATHSNTLQHIATSCCISSVLLSFFWGLGYTFARALRSESLYQPCWSFWYLFQVFGTFDG